MMMIKRAIKDERLFSPVISGVKNYVKSRGKVSGTKVGNKLR